MCFGVVALVLGQAALAQAQSKPDAPYAYIQAEGHFSIFSDAPNRSVFAASRGGALRAGQRWGSLGLFAHIEQNLWRTSEADSVLTDGVLNIGIGGESLFFDGRVRASVAVGTSTLLFDTLLDETGATGYFVDIRPGGLRWFMSDWIALEFHPLSFALMVPVVTTPRLAHIEYRTALVLEFLP